MDVTQYLKLMNARSPYVRADLLENSELSTQAIRIMVARASLSDPHPAVRRVAADVIGDLGAGLDFYRLLQATFDDSWPVRSSAVNALGRLSLKRSAKRVAELLAFDQHFAVRRDASFALIRVTSDARPILKDRLKSEKDRCVRSSIFASLYVLGEAVALWDIVQLWSDDDFIVRNNAINALTFVDIREGDKSALTEALDALILKEEHSGVRGDAENLRRSL